MLSSGRGLQLHIAQARSPGVGHTQCRVTTRIGYSRYISARLGCPARCRRPPAAVGHLLRSGAAPESPVPNPTPQYATNVRHVLIPRGIMLPTGDMAADRICVKLLSTAYTLGTAYGLTDGCSVELNPCHAIARALAWGKWVHERLGATDVPELYAHSSSANTHLICLRVISKLWAGVKLSCGDVGLGCVS